MVLAVDFSNNSLIHARRGAILESLGQLESRSLVRRHVCDSSGQRLQVGDRAQVGLDVERVPVTFLFGVVHGFLVLVLAVSRSAFRCPCCVGDPFVIEDRPVERTSSRTSQVNFLQREERHEYKPARVARSPKLTESGKRR